MGTKKDQETIANLEDRNEKLRLKLTKANYYLEECHKYFELNGGPARVKQLIKSFLWGRG